MAEAREFSTSTAYAVGDLAMNSGILYRFISAHSAGTWDDSDVEAVDSTFEQELTRILAGYNNAMLAAEYASTIPFVENDYSPGVIEGTRYKFTLTSAVDPR